MACARCSNNQQAVAIPIFQAPGSNAIQISDHVRATMEELKKNFPQGLDYSIVYDPTVFVRDSIKAVVHTLLEAVLLVVLVVILFLQTWRASIIPLLAVPVSIIGTFAAMHLFGFSINNLSLFGLVLAIGIVVDDAIVVVENVERNIEAGLAPREATLKAMSEVTGPIIAIALVLCAVFVPIAFISGLTGEFYRQFALTIAFSTVISAFNSLTLSPALSALLLKSHGAPKDWLARGMDKASGQVLRAFNRLFHRGSEGYGTGRGRDPDPQVRRAAGLWRSAGGDRAAVPPGAAGLCAAPGQAISRQLRAAAPGRHPGPHRESDPPDVGDRAQGSGGRWRRGVPRPVHQRLHQQPLGRHRVRDPEAVRPARAQRIPAWRWRSGCRPSSPASAAPSSPSSRRRRCRAWAPSAASSFRSRTAPTRAMPS